MRDEGELPSYKLGHGTRDLAEDTVWDAIAIH